MNKAPRPSLPLSYGFRSHPGAFGSCGREDALDAILACRITVLFRLKLNETYMIGNVRQLYRGSQRLIALSIDAVSHPGDSYAG